MASNPHSHAAGPGTRRKSKCVTAQHTLERVRNNQRRHRARQRDYIATLEHKVSQAEQSVTALRDQVDALQAELALAQFPTQVGQVASGCPVLPDQLQRDESGRSPPSLPSPQEIGFQAFGLLPEVADLGVLTLSSSCSASDLALQTSDDQLIIGGTKTLLSATATPDPTATTTGSCCSEGRSSKPDDNKTDERAVVLSGENLLPGYVVEPATEAYYRYNTEGESTMLCAEAYLLIEQQNFRGVSQKDVATWLWHGFRKSVRRDEGCRVKTDLLFSLLAFISDA
jgi:hypothetical protein